MQPAARPLHLVPEAANNAYFPKFSGLFTLKKLAIPS